MEQKQPMTPEEYRAQTAEKRTEVKEMKSGSVWKLRRPQLSQLVTKGKLPSLFLTEGVQAWKGAGLLTDDATATRLTDDDIYDTAGFWCDLVSDCTVVPHITDDPKEPNDIHPDDVLDVDYQEIFDWIKSCLGAAAASGLRGFHNRRKGIANARNSGSVLRPEAVSDAAN